MLHFLSTYLVLGVVAIPLVVLVPGLSWWKVPLLLASAQLYSALSAAIERHRVKEADAKP